MILKINPAASAPTPTQIATQDIAQFNAIASMVHHRMLNGIPGQAAMIDQQGNMVQAERPEVTPAQYNEGLVIAIGQEAYNRLEEAAGILIGNTGTEPAPATA